MIISNELRFSNSPTVFSSFELVQLGFYRFDWTRIDSTLSLPSGNLPDPIRFVRSSRFARVEREKKRSNEWKELFSADHWSGKCNRWTFRMEFIENCDSEKLCGQSNGQQIVHFKVPCLQLKTDWIFVKILPARLLHPYFNNALTYLSRSNWNRIVAKRDTKKNRTVCLVMLIRFQTESKCGKFIFFLFIRMDLPRRSSHERGYLRQHFR